MSDYHIVTKAENGTVSFIRNVDEQTARDIAKRLRESSDLLNDKEGSLFVSPGTLNMVEILGPTP